LLAGKDSSDTNKLSIVEEKKACKAGIAGMTIANPEGYSGVNIFEMEGIVVGFDLQDPLMK